MARMRVCGACGSHNSLKLLFCEGLIDSEQCGAPLIDADIIDSDGEVGPHSQPADIDTSILSTQLEDARKLVPHLHFDWGQIPIDPKLAIGRDATFSPIASHLQEFDTVSRRHAILNWDGSGVFVRHLGTSNPTYLNRQALNQELSVPVVEGDTLQFSSQVTATLRFN